MGSGIPERMRGMGPKLGAGKTSMLQDAERGRPLELEGLMAAVVEIGDLLGVPMPQTKAVYGLARVRSEAIKASAAR